MTEKELTWVATVFDCEGCITVQKTQYLKKDMTISHYEYPIAMIGHGSLDVIDRFHALVGFGKRYNYLNKSREYNYTKKNGEVSRYEYTNKKQVYWWKALGDDVKPFIALIWNEWLSEYRRETIINLGLAPTTEDDMGSKKHVHKYGRQIGQDIWKCHLPNCTHYMPTNYGAPVGKYSLCWECEQVFILSYDDLVGTMPVCSTCATRVITPLTNIDDIIAKVRERTKAKEEADKPIMESIPEKD